ncbi:adenosylcobinamide-GDP ribazoletransferase [Lachnotalea glycerini]|jgi:adenosylcobinamide-GDP ribazoletransferase|uniref:Adenosylcobinamide-GDP ribazoletransferase n=1 Tax=Lachnotalea glycerini TaxID=1763509 RepID=A0A371JK72_9FIRM|nr:adenosylcobinamide-GDP ribazoletransferase [Lachnotalea glycerini]RDY33129.1 adenosylcobinamide-GDP ribazoletransferase [Lachnotalea glycerini]
MIWNGFKIAFSMYSKIPMPKTVWNEKNMRYSMCFFPFVGAVIGACIFLWNILCRYFDFGSMLCLSGYLVIPILITGGIHLDGFIDTQDALSSYQPQERKLEILKDSHIGAFALISSMVYFIIMGGVWSDLKQSSIPILAIGFVLSRALSGFSVVTFSCAKNSGLVHAFSDAAQKKTVRIVMIILIICSAILLVLTGGVVGFCILLGAMLVFYLYRHMAYKQFGGITGDIAGWFLQSCELIMALSALIGQLIIH